MPYQLMARLNILSDKDTEIIPIFAKLIVQNGIHNYNNVMQTTKSGIVWTIPSSIEYFPHYIPISSLTYTASSERFLFAQSLNVDIPLNLDLSPLLSSLYPLPQGDLNYPPVFNFYSSRSPYPNSNQYFRSLLAPLDFPVTSNPTQPKVDSSPQHNHSSHFPYQTVAPPSTKFSKIETCMTFLIPLYSLPLTLWTDDSNIILIS